MSWDDLWPERDGLAWDGSWSPGLLPRGESPPTVDLVWHEHQCPDGTRVVCASQWIAMTQTTLDRWYVGEYHIATSSRVQENTVPPDFGWVDQQASVAS